MSHLSDREKWAVISTYESTRNVSIIARRHGITPHTVRLWTKRYKLTGSVAKIKPPGPKPAMSAAVAETAMDMLCAHTFGGAASVARELHMQGLTSRQLHKGTIIKHARAAAKASGTPIRCVKGAPKKRLTNANKATRLAFATANKHTNFARVLFTDRSKFHFKYPGAAVQQQQWLKKGQEAQAHAVNHAQTVNIYAGISKFGVTAPHIVTGTSKYKGDFVTKGGKTSKAITAHEYASVLTSTLLPAGKRIFTNQGFGHWVMQQDNDPAHKSATALVKQWNHEQHASVTILQNWPPNSPDLNPIENVWAYVKAKVNAKGCKTFEEFKQAVMDEFKHIPKRPLINLFNSMPKRIASVIELAGDKTKY